MAINMSNLKAEVEKHYKRAFESITMMKKAFVEERKTNYGFKYDEEYRFYVLSETEKILLPHKPRLEVVANQSKRIYSLATILSGKEII